MNQRNVFIYNYTVLCKDLKKEYLDNPTMYNVVHNHYNETIGPITRCKTLRDTKRKIQESVDDLSGLENLILRN